MVGIYNEVGGNRGGGMDVLRREVGASVGWWEVESGLGWRSRSRRIARRRCRSSAASIPQLVVPSILDACSRVPAAAIQLTDAPAKMIWSRPLPTAIGSRASVTGATRRFYRGEHRLCTAGTPSIGAAVRETVLAFAMQLKKQHPAAKEPGSPKIAMIGSVAMSVCVRRARFRVRPMTSSVPTVMYEDRWPEMWARVLTSTSPA